MTPAHGIAAGVVSVAVGMGMFIWGQAVGHNDARLFQLLDQQKTKLAARNCGKHAALWRHAISGEYACLYVNPNGDAVVQPSVDAHLLSAQR